MAKVQYTAVVAGMSGKLNGNVFFRNKGGNCLRTKTTPNNPQTSWQAAVRSIFGNFSSGWRSLTEGQRDAWNAAAENFPYTDVFGDTRILSGQNLYIKLNTNLTNAGQTPLTSPPASASVPQALIVSIVADTSSSAITVTIDDASVPAGFTLLLWGTACVSPGKNFLKNRFRLLGDFTLTTGATNAFSAWAARFGALSTGQKLAVKAYYVNNETGQIGVPTQEATIVVA